MLICRKRLCLQHALCAASTRFRFRDGAAAGRIVKVSLSCATLYNAAFQYDARMLRNTALRSIMLISAALGVWKLADNLQICIGVDLK